MAIIDYFPPSVAADLNGNLARNADATVYALGDQSLSTPLAITDVQGVPMAKLTSSALGIYPAFRVVNGTQQIIVVSGDLKTPMTSLSVDAKAAETAAQEATNSAATATSAASTAATARSDAVAAAAAAQAVGNTNDTIIEGRIKATGSKTELALRDKIVDVVDGLALGGQDIRLDALAAGQRLAASLAGSMTETAKGVTVGTIVKRYDASSTSLGTVILTDSTDTITVSAPHGLKVGDVVTFGTVSTSTGIAAGTMYFVRSVPTSTTLTVAVTPGGSLQGIVNDGTALAIYRRERAYDRNNSVINPALRITETRAVQSAATYPQYEFIKPDPTIVTYAPGIVAGTGMRVETEYLGKRLDVLLRYGGNSNVQVRVYVDGRLAKTLVQSDFTASSVNAGEACRLPLTFSDYRRRRITVEYEYVAEEFVGFDIEGGYELVYPTGDVKGPRVLFEGDSFIEGTGSGSAVGLVRWVSRLMGWIDVWKGGSGSTGYTADGTRLALIDRYANDIIAQQAQVVIIAMGINDSGISTATVVADATTIWNAVLASSYTKELVIIGPWPNNGGVGTISAGIVALDNALRALAKTKGVRYISPVGEGWQFPLSDATHPDAAGHEYLAQRIAGHLSVPYIEA